MNRNFGKVKSDNSLEYAPAALAAIKTALQLTDAEAEAMLAFGATGGQP